MALQQITNQKKNLRARVRHQCIVKTADIREAFTLGLDAGLLWAAAGAGLAMRHRKVGIAPNIEELRGDFPDDYLRGYYYEQTAHQLEVAQGVA